MVKDSPPPQERSLTPDRAPITDPNTLKTPKQSQDIRQALNNARGYKSPTNRSVRALLHKVEKALDQGNTERAKLRAEIARLKEDFRAVKPYTRKRVRYSSQRQVRYHQGYHRC